MNDYHMSLDKARSCQNVTRLFRFLLLSVSFLSICSIAQNENPKTLIKYPSWTIALTGELGVEYGELVIVEGVVVEGQAKGHDGGPNLLVQGIEDSTIQSKIQIPMKPFFHDFGTSAMPSIEAGTSYSLRVYETGSFVGRPRKARLDKGVWLQTTGFYFHNGLSVLSATEIKPIECSPADFKGRKDLFIGKAKNVNDIAYVVGRNWRIELLNASKWSSKELRKDVEIYREVIPMNQKDVFQIKDGAPRLLHLKDQIGKAVKLRGKAYGGNGKWKFNYRGVWIYVKDMGELPNWLMENHGRPIEISRMLSKEKLPKIDQL
ncbi:MAG: hypothetical protein ACI828_001507 [Flavobacteriales bacterium]|jgi:hypothetical protein